jgi:ribose-phosphate pyrophosphokinase
MYVIPGPASPVLSSRVATKLNLPLAKVVYSVFPDGELYVKVEKGVKDAVVIQSIRSSDDIVYLMLLFDILSNYRLIAVVPYMGYARQDRAFNEGEAVSIRAIAEFLENHAEKVISVNLHSREAASHFKNLVEIDAMTEIGRYYTGQDVIMISPDKGSLERVKVAAKVAGCEYDYLEKVRIDAETVEIYPKNIDVENKRVVIVDDIISTGGTIAKAAETLKASYIEAACVHAVLAANSLNKLFSSGIKDVIATDTVEQAVSKISVADLIAEKITEVCELY